MAWPSIVHRTTLAAAVLTACGDDGSAMGDATDPTSTTSSVDTGPDGTSGAPSSGDIDGTATAGSADTTGADGTESETGSTGGPDEGEFADLYRVAFLQADEGVAVTSVWVDVDITASTAPAPLLPGGISGAVGWTSSPSRRWLFIRSGDPVSPGWLVDAEKLGAGVPDDWAHGMGPEIPTDPVFLPAEVGIAHRAQLSGVVDVRARTLGDMLGPPVVVNSSPANPSWLSGFDDQLAFANADGEIHLAPAQVTASTSEHVANVGLADLPLQLWISADGSAIYARDIGGEWWLARVDASSPPDLAPIGLAPDPGDGVRSVLITPARNRLFTFDFDLDWQLPEPLTYVTLDGASASAPVTVPISTGPDGTFVGIVPQLGADGDHLYVSATTRVTGRGAYIIDVSQPDPALTQVAGPGIDDTDVFAVLLSHDEQRLFYVAWTPEHTVKMVDLAGGSMPVDLAPELVSADGRPGRSLVESEDGRAVFFVGQDALGAPYRVYRVGIVDGVPTPPVAMSDGAGGSTNGIQLFPAPDGGGVAFVDETYVAWVSVYGDGVPAWFQVSSAGYSVGALAAVGLPTFLPLP